MTFELRIPKVCHKKSSQRKASKFPEGAQPPRNPTEPASPGMLCGPSCQARFFETCLSRQSGQSKTVRSENYLGFDDKCNTVSPTSTCIFDFSEQQLSSSVIYIRLPHLASVRYWLQETLFCSIFAATNWWVYIATPPFISSHFL